jgi:hypothetical protein
MRSPITQNGWSKPMMAVLLAELTTVRVIRDPFPLKKMCCLKVSKGRKKSSSACLA